MNVNNTLDVINDCVTREELHKINWIVTCEYIDKKLSLDDFHTLLKAIVSRVDEIRDYENE